MNTHMPHLKHQSRPDLPGKIRLCFQMWPHEDVVEFRLEQALLLQPSGIEQALDERAQLTVAARA